MGVKITVISVGKVKERFLREGIAEFEKRLGRFCKLELVEIPDEEREGGIKKEGERIMVKIPQSSFVVVLDIKGKQFASEELADKMDELMLYGTSHFTFVIGGSHGLSNEVKNRADLRLSFSKMTFPHQMFKLMLLEQIYRAFKINANEAYHK